MHPADQAGQHEQRETDRDQVRLPPLPTHRRRDEDHERKNEDERAQVHEEIVNRKIDAFAHILPRRYLDRLERHLGGTMPPYGVVQEVKVQDERT